MARYIDAANALEQETKMGLRRFQVCDNVDLETILMEYESYYFVKFQKYPKIVKKASDTGTWLFSRSKALSHLQVLCVFLILFRDRGCPPPYTERIHQKDSVASFRSSADNLNMIVWTLMSLFVMSAFA